MRRALIIAGLLVLGLPGVALASAYLTFRKAETVTEHVSHIAAAILVSKGYTGVEYYRPRRAACFRESERTIACKALVTAQSGYQKLGCVTLIRVHLYAYPKYGRIGRWTRITGWTCSALPGYAPDSGQAALGATQGSVR